MSRTSSANAPLDTARTKSFNFVALSLEVKELIYKHAMFSGGHLDSKIHATNYITTQRYLRKGFPAICFTNKLERIITTRLYLRYQTICLERTSDASVLEAFLSEFGEAREGLSWVKYIECGHIADRRTQGFHEDIGLIKICPALKTVMFTFAAYDLCYIRGRFRTRYKRASSFGRPCTGAEVAAYLHLYDLAKCGHLTKIRFEVVHRGSSIVLGGLESVIKEFTHTFAELHGSAAVKRLDVCIIVGGDPVWVFEPRKEQ